MSRRVGTTLLAGWLALGGLIGCGSSADRDTGPGEAPISTPARPGIEASASPEEPLSDAPDAEPAEPAESAGLASLAEAAESAAARLSPSPTPLSGPVLGADISWPQCPRGLGIPERPTLGMPMPVAEAEYVVIGLTNGPGYTKNPCLADQVGWAREHGLMTAAYAVASRPSATELARHGDDGPFDAGSRTGRLANAGYQQGRFNLAGLRSAGLRTPIIWIDVEPVPDFDWPDDDGGNAAVVRGVARAYQDGGYRIGVYSTPYMWEQIVGDLRLGVPEWRAAGGTSREEALRRCGDDWVIQGGAAVLGQWVMERRDHNVTCPEVTDLADWFHQ